MTNPKPFKLNKNVFIQWIIVSLLAAGTFVIANAFPLEQDSTVDDMLHAAHLILVILIARSYSMHALESEAKGATFFLLFVLALAFMCYRVYSVPPPEKEFLPRELLMFALLFVGSAFTFGLLSAIQQYAEPPAPTSQTD